MRCRRAAEHFQACLTPKEAASAEGKDMRSYRPITLLNCDYKIAAAAIAARLGVPLGSVIDSSQTAFLPKRWIGDNVLANLDYVQTSGEPGAIVFLGLAKAFDRLDRAWILRSLTALGAPACIPRWVEVLHGGTCATEPIMAGLQLPYLSGLGFHG